MKLDVSALKKVDWLDLLLRYGDKAVLGLASLILLWSLVKVVGALRQVPDVSPTELTELAENVRSRLSQSNATPELLAEAGVKNPDFTGLVAELSREVNPNLVADADLFYRFLDFGGILREQPEIFAPEHLYVAAGRGGLLLYKLDREGNKIPAVQKTKKTKPKKRRRRSSRRRLSTDEASMMGGMGEMGYGGYGGMMDGMEGMMGGMMGGMGGMMGGMEGMMGGYPGMGAGGYPGMGGMDEEGMMGGMPGAAPSRPASRPRASSGTDSRRIAGLESRKQEDKKEEEQTTTATAQQYQMEPRGFRWVVITAVFPHKKQLEEYRRALKAAESPEYVKVVVERRALQSDGSFSDWQPVDTRVNAWIAKRRVGVEQELPALQPYLIDELVEKLPQLAYGAWEFVDHVMAVEAAGQKPEEAAQQAAGQQGQPYGPGDGMPGAGSEEEMYGMGGSGYPGMMGGGMPGMGGMGGMEGMEGAGYPGMGGPTGYPGMGPGGMPGPAGAGAAGATGQGGQGGQPFAPPGSAAQEQNRYIEVEYVQVRFIDYTVDEGRTYQYRMKVVVKNPNYNRPDVAEDAYRKPEFLEGPWSKPSRPVYVGKDVEYYLVNAKFDERSGLNRGVFEVHRWDTQTGDWYCSTFEVVPGAPVGNRRKMKILTWDEEIIEKQVDFTTGAVLLDVVGGRQRFVEQGTTYSYEEPVQALVVTREGDLIWRVLSDDQENPIRKERAEYCEEIRQIIRELERAEDTTPLSSGFGGFNTPQEEDENRIPGTRRR